MLTNVAAPSLPLRAHKARLCPHCDVLVRLPAMVPGQRARCPRCRTVLSSYRRYARARSVGYSLSALLLWGLSFPFTFIVFQVAGLRSVVSLQDIPAAMTAGHYALLSVLVWWVVLVTPALTLVLLALLGSNVLPGQSLRRQALRALQWLRLGCMAEIFVAGTLVSFVKLMAYGNIDVGLSFYPLCGFVLLLIPALYHTPYEALWCSVASRPALPKNVMAGRTGLRQGLRCCPCCQAVLPNTSTPCPRCQVSAPARRSNRQHALTWSLLMTSVLLYLPANLLPLMTTVVAGTAYPSTIIAGVILLWEEGSYPVALVIFIASLLVPTLKMLAIGWLCYGGGQGRTLEECERRFGVYEMVEFVGRWSMVDVFVIAVLGALVRMGSLMQIAPAPGVLLFCAVVLLTMVAVSCFDPRLIWDGLAEKEKTCRT